MAEWWEKDQVVQPSGNFWDADEVVGGQQEQPVENPWYVNAAQAADDVARLVANGATFGFADKLAGWAGGQGTEAERELTNQASERAGTAAIPAEVAGALMTGSGLANAGLTFAGRGGNLAARTGLMGLEGAGYGALSALGNDQDVGTGAIIGGALGSAGNLIGEGIQAGINRATQRGMVPTIDELKQQATDLYRQAESRGVVADALMTQSLADDVTKIARDAELITPKGRVSDAYPKAKEAMHLMQDYAGETMNPTQMQVVRDTLADARNSTQGKERRIASKMLNAFDEFTKPIAPELEDARKISQRYIKAGQLEKMRELGDVRASQYTNAGTENAMRTEYRLLDRAITKGTEAGWSPAEQAAIQAVSRGTPVQNALRTAGKLAPTGPVSFIGGAGVPYMIGHSIGGYPAGVAAAAGTAGLGYASKAASNMMQQRSIELAELLARSGGQLPNVNSRSVADALTRSLIYGATPQFTGE